VSTTSDRNSDSSGRKKVLVIAHPELAAAIYEALDPYIESPAGPRTLVHTTSSEKATVAWLCDRIFPSPSLKKTAFFKKAWSAFKTLGRNQPLALPATNATGSPMSLFGWGGYQFVIIQDLWPVDSDSGRTLECAGYVLANLDYYLWGNFGTKKIILVSDKEFPQRKAEWIRELHLPSLTSVDAVVSEFDRKQAFELVELGGEGELRERLVRLLKGDENPHNSGSQEIRTVSSSVTDGREQENPSKIVDHLRYPVLQEVLRALQSYVGEQAEVLVVDDEFSDLDETFKQLTGRQLDDQTALSSNQVKVTKASEGIVRQVPTFDALVDLCMREFHNAASSSKRYTLLVTDILFRGPTWNKTGLDLIDTLRLRLKQEKARRIGIVAYTAFTTPFIAMSSHQRGADFVVAKLDFGPHDVKVKGSQRLMMTLAFLCFQKSFLSDKRKEADDMRKAAKSGDSFARAQRSLRQLQAVLPKHTVSLHLQQEWQDTCYLFEALGVYESESLKEIYQEVSTKYD
jgi:CheY-like chemotaxis protein